MDFSVTGKLSSPGRGLAISRGLAKPGRGILKKQKCVINSRRRTSLQQQFAFNVRKTAFYTDNECLEITDPETVIDARMERQHLWNIGEDEDGTPKIITDEYGHIHVKEEIRAINTSDSLAKKMNSNHSFVTCSWSIIMTDNVNPNGAFKFIWNIIMIIVILISTTTVAFYIGFDVEAAGFWHILDISLDTIFIFDICLNFRTSYYDENGMLVSNHILIAKKYLSNWFAIDFISAIPIDQIIFTTNPQTSVFVSSSRFLRILRFSRLLYILKHMKIPAQLRLKDNNDFFLFHPSVQRGLSLISLLYLVAHFVACIFYWIVTLADTDTYTWADAYYQIRYSSIWVKYQTSLYWSFTTLTTVGYGDVVPVTLNERIYVSMILLLGAALFGYTVGTIGQVFEGVDLRNHLYYEKIQLVKEYIRSRRLHKRISLNLLEHYRYYYTHTSVFDFSTVVSCLPTEQSVALQKIRHGPIISQFSFMMNTNPLFATELADLMRPFNLPYNQILFMENDVPQQLYFVRHGFVDLLSTVTVVTDERTMRPRDAVVRIASIGNGDFFGESTLFDDQPQTYTAKAAKFTEIFFVNKKELLELLERWPVAKASLMSLGREFHQHIISLREAVTTTRIKNKHSREYLVADFKDEVKRNLKPQSPPPPLPPMPSDSLQLSPPPLQMRKEESATESDMDMGATNKTIRWPSVVSAKSSAGTDGFDSSKIYRTNSYRSEHSLSDDETNMSDVTATREVPRRADTWIPQVLGDKLKAMDISHGHSLDHGDATSTYNRFHEMWRKRNERLNLGQISPLELWQAFHVIHPEANWKIAWDVAISMFIMYSVIFDTYSLAFDQSTEGGFLIMDYLVTIFFFIDIIFNFFTTHVDSKHRLVTDRRIIINRYLKGWFCIDVLSTIPFDVIFDAIAQNHMDLGIFRITKFLRFMRLLKIWRLAKVSEFLERSSEMLTIPPAFLRLFKLGLSLCFSAHFAGCLWFAIANNESEETVTWLDAYCFPSTTAEDSELLCEAQRGTASNYMTSLYWALTTMATVGYGDVKPSPPSTAETVLAILAIVLGSLITAYFISAVVNTITNMDLAEKTRRRHTDELQALLKDLQVPVDLGSTLTRQFKYSLDFNGALDQEQILRTVPVYLKSELVHALYRS
eukprot:gene8584-17711_t